MSSITPPPYSSRATQTSTISGERKRHSISTVVIDLANRMVVGWATKRTLDHSLPLAALMMAIEQRRPPAGLILHSDRGVQYACREYRAVIARYGTLQSMSRNGDC